METKEQVKLALEKDIEKYNKCNKTKIKLFNGVIDDIAENLTYLADAINNKHSVFAICEKEPPNLDKGNHYYSVCYTRNNIVHKIWLGEAILLFEGKISKRNHSLPPYVFYSEAVGVSGLFDATDRLFKWLADVGLCKYVQIHCL